MKFEFNWPSGFRGEDVMSGRTKLKSYQQMTLAD